MNLFHFSLVTPDQICISVFLVHTTAHYVNFINVERTRTSHLLFADHPPLNSVV